MSTICRYTMEDAHGNNPWDTVVFENHEAQEAKAFAREHGLRLICNTYEWVDSEMVEDFTQPRPTMRIMSAGIIDARGFTVTYTHEENPS